MNDPLALLRWSEVVVDPPTAAFEIEIAALGTEFGGEAGEGLLVERAEEFVALGFGKVLA